MLKVGAKVEVSKEEGIVVGYATYTHSDTEEGIVVGYATYTHSDTDEQHCGYIVELKEGFFNQDRTIYASMIVVHPDNLKAIK
jgi:hypothetical protein